MCFFTPTRLLLSLISSPSFSRVSASPLMCCVPLVAAGLGWATPTTTATAAIPHFLNSISPLPERPTDQATKPYLGIAPANFFSQKFAAFGIFCQIGCVIFFSPPCAPILIFFKVSRFFYFLTRKIIFFTGNRVHHTCN